MRGGYGRDYEMSKVVSWWDRAKDRDGVTDRAEGRSVAARERR